LRLGAIATCANPTYTERELTFQLKVSGAKFLILHPDSREIGLKAAEAAGIPLRNILTISDSVDGLFGLNDFIAGGKSLPQVERIGFRPGEARKRMAFLSFSSGTSGLPKGVMISHGNVIANLCQAYEVDKSILQKGEKRVACGVLPFYHSMTNLCVVDV
jgi:4-coumarate--CoA ligase